MNIKLQTVIAIEQIYLQRRLVASLKYLLFE